MERRAMVDCGLTSSGANRRRKDRIAETNDSSRSRKMSILNGTCMKCASKNCRARVTKRDHSRLCAKHRSRQFKERFPIKYAFNKLRSRAKERGKVFELTYEQ